MENQNEICEQETLRSWRETPNEKHSWIFCEETQKPHALVLVTEKHFSRLWVI